MFPRLGAKENGRSRRTGRFSIPPPMLAGQAPDGLQNMS